MKKLFILSLAFLSLASCSDNDNSNIAPIEPLPSASDGGVFGLTDNPLNVGGSNEQNQVYVSLSGQEATAVARDSWDLGFYCGNDFRVVLNSAVMMAAKKLDTNDITLTQQQDPTVAVSTFQASNLAYVDNPDGELASTVFGTIATSEAEAKVFLVNMGAKVPDAPAASGSTNVVGESRGWKKVKVWAEGNGYKVQYADLASANAQTTAITKDPVYNHIFFSLLTNAAVKAEPAKADWDMKFSTFTNEVFQEGVSAGSYFFSDYVVINKTGGVTAVKIEGDKTVYDALTLASFTAGNYTFSADQRAIGETWRDVFTRVVYSDVFYVVKDAAGNLYKVKFISMVDSNGNRGFPVFQYGLLK